MKKNTLFKISLLVISVVLVVLVFNTAISRAGDFKLEAGETYVVGTDLPKERYKITWTSSDFQVEVISGGDIDKYTLVKGDVIDLTEIDYISVENGSCSLSLNGDL